LKADGDASSPAGEATSVRVWDLPVRLVHWVIVVLMAVSWSTAEYDWIEWHKVSGYSMLAVVSFRLYWGFRGSTTARFKQFVRGPAAVVRHARSLFSRPERTAELGHSPLGGWNVIAMLLLLLVQVCLGLFAIDVYGIESGPLADWVSFDTGRRIARLHQSVFNLLCVFVSLHVVAILGYLFFRRENLILPMVTGVKRVLRGDAERGDGR